MASSSLSSFTTILLFIGCLMMSSLSTAASSKNRLDTGESMNTFESLLYGNYYLTLYKYCHLSFGEGNKQIWGIRVEGLFCTLTLQADGNLVMHNGTSIDGAILWAYNTYQQNSYLLVTNQVAIYDNQNNAIWVNGDKVHSLNPKERWGKETDES